MTARPSPPLALVLGACLLGATACGPTATLDVSMSGVSITVPRIVTPAVTLVAPPPVSLPAPLPLPALPALPAVPPLLAVTELSPRDPCPPADQLAVPSQLAEPTLDHPPAGGSYPQRSVGTFTSAGSTPPSGRLVGALNTVVTSLPQGTSAIGQQLDNWKVQRTASGPVPSSSVEVYQLVHPSSSPVGTASGIYLTGLAWKDSIRGDLTFAPVGGGVEVLPLPVGDTGAFGTVGYQPPAEFESSQTDPLTQTTLTLQGTVTGKARIDVCGSVVDTYTVSLSGALTTPTQVRQVAWRMQVATQFGGAIIQDQLTLTDPNPGFSWDRTLTNTTVPPSGAKHG